MLAALLTSLAAAAQSCADVGSPELPGTPGNCPAIAQVPDVCEQGLMAAACPLSCGRCPPPLPPAPPGGYSPPPTVEELFRSSAAAVLSHPLGDLSVFESSRLELDPRPLRNFELLGGPIGRSSFCNAHTQKRVGVPGPLAWLRIRG